MKVKSFFDKITKNFIQLVQRKSLAWRNLQKNKLPLNQRDVLIHDISTDRTNKEIDLISRNEISRKLSNISKKSNRSKEQRENNLDKSKILNESALKSESNRKLEFKSEIGINNLISNKQIEHKNKQSSNNNLDNSENISTSIRKKYSNLKSSSSIMKNSSQNLFLTNLELSKNSDNILNLDALSFPNKNALSKPNIAYEKASSNNLHKVSFDEENVKSNKNLVKIAKNINASFIKHSAITENANLKNKKRRNKTNNLSITKSTAVNGSLEPNIINNTIELDIIESQKNKNKAIPLIKKFETAKPKKNKVLKIFHNPEGKTTNFSFSDDDSDESFLNFQRNININKINNNLNYNTSNKKDNEKHLLVKNHLPPLQIRNKKSEAISIIDHKINLDISNEPNENLNLNEKHILENKKQKNNIRISILNSLELSKRNAENKDKDNHNKYKNTEKESNKKDKQKEKSIDKTNLLLQNNYNRNIFNLKLPKLRVHQKNKSHFDIMENLKNDIKSIGACDVNENNNIGSKLKAKFQSFILNKSNEQDNHKLNNSYGEIFENNFFNNEENNEIFLNTEEKNLHAFNLKRIKPKRFPLELDKPKHNNTLQDPKSQIFLKKFINKCKNGQNNVKNVIRDISANIMNTNDYYKNDKINLVRIIIEDGINHEIDKEIFLMDNPNGKQERSIVLNGPPIQGANKYLFQNKNSALLVGEVISKISEEFAMRCKDVVQNRLVVLNSQQKRKKRLEQEQKIQKIKAVEKVELHKQIEKAVEQTLKVKMNALKEKVYD